MDAQRPDIHHYLKKLVEENGTSSARYIHLPPTSRHRSMGWVERSSPMLPFNETKWGKKYGECWESIDDLQSFIDRLRVTKVVDSDLIDRGVRDAEKLFETNGLRSRIQGTKPQKREGGQSWMTRSIRSPGYREYSQALEFAIPRLQSTLQEFKKATASAVALEYFVQYFEIRIDNLSNAFNKIQSA